MDNFSILGATWGRKNQKIKILHLSGLGFAFFVQIFNWDCPLTYVEVWFRFMHDPKLAYIGSFIIHYLEKLIYIEISKSILIMFTVLLCLLNIWLYLKKN